MLAISRRRSSTNGAPPQAPIPGKYHAAVGRFPGTEACGYALRLWESCISLRRICGSLREGTSEARCWPYSLSLRALTARLSGDTRSAAATKAPGAPPRDPPQRRWERSAAARARHFPSSPRGTGSPPKPCPARLAARPRPSQRDAQQHRGTAARPRDILTPPAPARRRPITVATAPPFRPSRLLRGGGEPGPWRSLFGGLFLRASSRCPFSSGRQSRQRRAQCACRPPLAPAGAGRGGGGGPGPLAVAAPAAGGPGRSSPPAPPCPAERGVGPGSPSPEREESSAPAP